MQGGGQGVGHIPIDRPGDVDRVAYAPTSPTTGEPYAPRTIARHRNVVEAALKLSQERWLAYGWTGEADEHRVDVRAA